MMLAQPRGPQAAFPDPVQAGAIGVEDDGRKFWMYPAAVFSFRPTSVQTVFAQSPVLCERASEDEWRCAEQPPRAVPPPRRWPLLVGALAAAGLGFVLGRIV